MIRLFDRVASDQRRRSAVIGAFLGGYLAVWSAFGAVAFLGDVGLHHLMDAAPWLSTRPWLIGAGALALAGAFQFSSLKDRCLSECRHPAAFVLPRYRRGLGPAFALGWSHGLFCVGCCGALMLLMFAAGVANLSWMAALTALMVYEKVGRHGRAASPLAGVLLLGLAILVALHPAWLSSPEAFEEPHGVLRRREAELPVLPAPVELRAAHQACANDLHPGRKTRLGGG